MNGNIAVTIESEDEDVPESKFIESIVRLACQTFGSDEAEINVQIVDDQTMTILNKQYRGKNQSTNVLSFTSDLPDWVENNLLGDIVICASVIRQEAEKFNKPINDRWAHILVHGTLHLLGMEHDDEQQQNEMEAMEQKIMNELGYEDPYQVTM